MASAAFHFDAQASLLKKSATAGGTVTLTLDSTDGVRTVLWEVATTDDNASTWTITGATSDGATLTVPSGVRGEACIIRCTVNGGTPLGTEDALDLVKTAKVYVWPEVMCAAEETESNQTYGWSGVVNQFVRGSQQKVHTADGSLTWGGTHVLTTAADGMTIPLVSAGPGKTMTVINAMAATTAVLTRSGSDTVVNGTSATAYNLPAGESVELRASATGSTVYVEHGGSGGGGGGLALGTGTPAAVAAAGSAGVSTDAAPFDHVHAHGNQSAGSSLHAAADGSNNGFMSAAHYTLVNGAAVAPTVSTLMKRDTDGTCQAVGLTLVNAGGNCELKATTNGTTAQSLDMLADVVTATFGECIVTATAGFSVAAGSHAQSDASGNYSFTRTNASALTEVYQNTIASVSISQTIDPSAAGAAWSIKSQGGAAGFANGVFTIGLPSTNTVLGSKVVVEVGAAVATVSDPFEVAYNGTRVIAVYQNGAGIAQLESPSTIYLNRVSGLGGYLGNPSVFSIGCTSGAAIISSNGYCQANSTYWYQMASLGEHRAPSILAVGWGVRSEWEGRTIVSDAATSTLFSFTIPTGEGIVAELWVTDRNTTDGTVSHHRTTAHAIQRNDGGTVTEVQAATVTATGDAGDTANLTITWDFSGTAARLRRNTANAKTRDISWSIRLYRSI